MELSCSQCGATLEVAPDARLLECSFCATALVVDGSNTLFNEMMQATVRPAEASSHLRRFLGGTQTVANLDRDAQIDEPTLEYFPFWAFTVSTDEGEQVILQPAAPSSLQGLQGLELPPGNTTPAAKSELPLMDPEVPLDTARQWLENKLGKVPIRRTVLYHLPIYRTDYVYRGQRYHAAVDAVSGKVFPANFPAKAEAPYVMVAVVALLVFGIEGLIIQNLIVKLLAYLLTAPPLALVAWFTSRKV